MIIRYIESELILYGFKKEKKNSGYFYSKISENIELMCFIEYNIKIYFISIYKWNNNRVRGSYCISSEILKDYPDFASSLFLKTLQNMPQYIGKEINVHEEVSKFIDETFIYK